MSPAATWGFRFRAEVIVMTRWAEGEKIYAGISSFGQAFINETVLKFFQLEST